MQNTKELSVVELQQILGGKRASFGKCVVGAWGVGAAGLGAGVSGGLWGMAAGGIGGELAYMGANGCL